MDEHTQRLEEQLAAHAGSAAWRHARALAAGAPAPAPEELEALADGRLDDPARRQALAVQLMAGDHWREALNQLGAGSDAPPASPRAVPVRPVQRPWWALAAAAAAALLLWVSLVGDGLAPGALVGVRLTDAAGLELRGAPTAPEGRVLVEVGVAGAVTLVHESAPGVLSLVPVEAAGDWAVVAAGEELLLPLHRSVRLTTGERWAVVLAAAPLSADAARALARRALAGEQLDDPAVVVIVVER